MLVSRVTITTFQCTRGNTDLDVTGVAAGLTRKGFLPNMLNGVFDFYVTISVKIQFNPNIEVRNNYLLDIYKLTKLRNFVIIVSLMCLFFTSIGHF